MYLSVFLVLLSSSIKQTESFYEGSDRYFSFFTHNLAKGSSVFAVLSILLAGSFYFFNHLKKMEQPVLGLEVRIFLGIKLLACFSYLIWGMLDSSLVLSFLITFIFSSYLVSMQSKYTGVFEHVAYAIALYSCVFLIINLYEYATNSSSVIWAGRLYGVTNHPNFIGGYSAIMIPFLLWSMQTAGKSVKIGLLFCALLLFAMVLLSGSRASLASLFIGSFIFSVTSFGMRKSIFYVFLLLFMSVPLLMLLVGFSGSSGFSLDRLLLTENTRAYVNFELWSVFLEYPITGNPTIIGSTSNSYLLVLARFGMIGGILLVSLILVTSRSILRVIREKKSSVSSAYIGSMAVILPYSLFEGVLVENFSLGQMVFVICIVFFGCSFRSKGVLN
jgi:hypothetical protein